MLTNYPKTYRENLAWRRKILLRARIDLGFRAKVRELFHRDVLFAFNAFFYTLDTRKRPKHHQPFCTYPFQDTVIHRIVEAIEAGRDLPLEKSRDMGASWMILLVFLWYWLNPEGGADFLMGSRIEDYVDKRGDMRTLFEKLRYALYKLPGWLLPDGFSRKYHDNFMKLENPETGASITGESNNPNFSTGGRYAAVLFDEFAKWDNTDVAAWTAAGDATPCRIPNSTPAGAAGQYYDLVTEPGSQKIRMHWSLHPEKAAGAYCEWPRPKIHFLTGEDLTHIVAESLSEELEKFWRSPWYDEECERRKPREIAQELDINYLGAGRLVFDGQAGARMSMLLRSVREPRCFFTVDFDGGRLLEVVRPREKESVLIVFREPDDRTCYTLGVDVVEGKEHGDYAVIKVLNRSTKSVDATFYGRIDEIRLARVIELTAKYYTTKLDAPWVGIETIGPGLSTFDICAEFYEVDNLFMMPSYDSAREQVSYTKGWKTGKGGGAARSKLVGGVKEWLLEGMGWADSRCVREMTTFVYDRGQRAGAKAGCNDDEVMALGIAIQIDCIAPLEDWEEPEKLREDGLSEKTFELTPVEGDPVGLEERCMASLLERKEAHLEDMMAFNDFVVGPDELYDLW